MGVTHLIKLLTEADRFRDGVRDFVGQLVLLCDVLHQLVHLVDVPKINTLGEVTCESDHILTE